MSWDDYSRYVNTAVKYDSSKFQNKVILGKKLKCTNMYFMVHNLIVIETLQLIACYHW